MKMNILLLFPFTQSCVHVFQFFCPFLSVCILMASLFQHLHNNLQAILVAAMHEKPATFHATTDRTEILDAGAGQGLVGEEWS